MEDKGSEREKYECAACGTSKEALLKCSRCKNTFYCDVDCQRRHWRTHKKECGISQNCPSKNSTSLGRCPYRPEGISVTPGVCPFRDLAEESQLQEIITKDLQNGLEGLLELEALGKSSEMSMQIPLQKTVTKVLKLVENFDLLNSDITNEYINACGNFISNMFQWEHNGFIKDQKFERIYRVSTKVIVSRGAACAFVYGKLLFWIEGHDKIKFQECIAADPFDETVVLHIQNAPIDSEWRNRVAILWDRFLERLGKYRQIEV